MSQVRWGIIGAGRIAKTFAQDITHCDNAKLVGIASRAEATAKQFAIDYNVDYAYGCYQSLYSDPNIDAIYIATPHNLHLEQSLAALGHDKAVLCEKPLTTSPEEAQNAIAAAKASNNYLIEGMWTYFLPAIQKAKQWVDEGKIGHLQHIRIGFGFPQTYNPAAREYNAALAGGCLLEMGIYPVALTYYFLQQSPHAMQSVGRLAPNGVEDDVVSVFNFDDCTATLTTSFRCKLQNYAHIIGTEGHISIPDFWRADTCKRFENDQCVEEFHDPCLGTGFEFQISSVSDDILAGKIQSDVVPWSASLAFQQHIAAVKQQIKGH